ncbi:hypothetical protein [Pedobacter suwonensis]|uniref:hypothetical protein n=1 Tax=Pedobacter suwonensis TaxID=332999 RepID=UPI0011A01917|nr:hypothetical protein [Pedobacter suwonensis]
MLKQQYDFVLSSRNTLLTYVGQISEHDFLTNNSSFGRGSIRNLLVHICQTYCAWIGERALGIEQEFYLSKGTRLYTTAKLILNRQMNILLYLQKNLKEMSCIKWNWTKTERF